MADKIYCGNGREKTFGDGGSIIKVTLDLKTLIDNAEAYGFKTKEGVQKVKIDIGKRKEKGHYGETHTVTIDTWKPDNKEGDEI